ncbi:hypothetical protein FP2506_00015, partial [Fulvimarina pelagi HTCC2506]
MNISKTTLAAAIGAVAVGAFLIWRATSPGDAA